MSRAQQQLDVDDLPVPVEDFFAFDGKQYREAPEPEPDCGCQGCAFHYVLDCASQRMAAEMIYGAPCGQRAVIYVEVLPS